MITSKQKVKVPTGKERLSITVTKFTGAKRTDTSAEGYATLKEILTAMTTPTEEFSRQSRQVREAYGTEDYTTLKEGGYKDGGLPAFIVGKFSRRAADACLEYVPLLGFDIDGSEEDLLSFNLEACKKSPHVFLAYPSPSFRGLRIFVWAKCNPESHKAYYKAIQEHLSEVLEIPIGGDGEHIDKLTSSLSRLWFYCAVPKDMVYYNLNSEIFEIKAAANNHPPPAVPPQHYEPIPEEVKVELCRRKVTESQRNLPAEGNRNNFVFAFACEMCRHGVSESRALSECLSYAGNGFDENEIRASVTSAYKSKKVEFNDAQIRKYLKNSGNGVEAPRVVMPPAPVPVQEDEEDEDEDEEAGSDNKAKILEDALKNKWDFRYNSITGAPEYRLKDKGSYKKVEDYDLNSIIRQLRLANTQGANKTRITETIESKFAPKVNPIEDYFKGLTYDGLDNIGMLCDTVTTVDGQDEMFRSLLRKWIVGAVANVFIKDRCANHFCFILTGAQSLMKSTWIRRMCPPELMDYYTEDNLDPDNKDDLFKTASNFIYNLDDYFADVTKKKISSLKAFITRSKVKGRRPYGRYEVELPKICSFIGSANDESFLHDPTGNRRFVPFEVTKLDFEALDKLDINQVWAEAYHLFRQGFRYWMTKDEERELAEHNTRYEVQTAEFELVTKYFRPAERSAAEEEWTPADIIGYLHGKNMAVRITPKKLGEALKKAGFQRYQKRAGGTLRWVYALDLTGGDEGEEEKTTPPHDPPPF